MQEQETTAQAPGAEPGLQEDMGSVQRLIGVVLEPGKTFAAIARRPTFLLAMVASIIVSVAAAGFMYSRIDMVQVMETQLRNSPAGQRMTSDEIRQQVETITNSPFYKVMLWVGPILANPIMMVALAGILMLMVYLGGSETTFLKMLGVTSHALFFMGLVGGVLMVLVILLAPDPQSIDIQNPLYTNLGHLADPRESPILNRLLTSLDIISFYVIYLLGLGVSKISSRMSVSKGVLLVAVPWLVYVGIAVLWRALVG
ncbi:MAG: hypothetical protein Kow001_07190 [Acidobacteriota bacterium]